MAPIPVKAVVSVTSEDSLHSASSLLLPSSGRKWLCSLNNRTGRAEAVFELSKRARIAAIDIINCGSAFVEVAVGDASTDNFITLLPQSTLMTVSDSRARRNRTKTVSFKRDKLSGSASGQKWNRVKVICRQPFNQMEQFGLQFIAFFSSTALSDTGSSSPVPCLTPPHPTLTLLSPPSASPSHPSLTSPLSRTQAENRTPKSEQEDKTHSSQSKKRSGLYPALPSQIVGNQSPIEPRSSRPPSHSGKTPKRPLTERDVKTEPDRQDCKADFEFSGLEKQSRLLKNALRGKPSGDASTETNPILERIMQERDKYRKTKQSSDDGTCVGGYSKKKLVQGELTKADCGVDFAASFASKTHSDKDMADSWRRVSNLEDRPEIGKEPDDPWGWAKGRSGRGRRGRGRRGGRQDGSSRNDGGWLKKRRRLEDMIGQCGQILGRAVEGGGGGGRSDREIFLARTAHWDNTDSCEPAVSAQEDEEGEVEGGNEEVTGRMIFHRPDLTPSGSSESATPPDGSGESKGGERSDAVRAIMGATSAISEPDSLAPIGDSVVACPICGDTFPHYVVEVHASQCGTDAARGWGAGPIVID